MHIHTHWLFNLGVHLLPGFEIREYVTPSLLKERVYLLPRKNNYLEPWLCLFKYITKQTAKSSRNCVHAQYSWNRQKDYSSQA